MTDPDYFKIRSQLASLRLKGYHGTNTTVWVDHQPYCDDPKHVQTRAPHGKHLLTGANLPELQIHRLAPCRKCEKCLKFRKLQWAERARFELKCSPRTWKVTLTISPRMMAAAIMSAKSAGTTLEPVLYSSVQRYCKRLRKAGHKFRYLAVHERGEEYGRSHYHLLLHEIAACPEVPKRAIEAKWPCNVHARLAGRTPAEVAQAAGYITSYTTKAFDTRPRASNGYGSGPYPELQRLTAPEPPSPWDAPLA